MDLELAVQQREATLLELLDRVLDKGVIIAGDLTISVANIDLVYLDLRILLASVDTLEKSLDEGLSYIGERDSVI